MNERKRKKTSKGDTLKLRTWQDVERSKKKKKIEKKRRYNCVLNKAWNKKKINRDAYNKKRDV